MNFLLDATLGMLVIWLAVKLVSRLVEHKQWSLLVFGEYGGCSSTDGPQGGARAQAAKSPSLAGIFLSGQLSFRGSPLR